MNHERFIVNPQFPTTLILVPVMLLFSSATVQADAWNTSTGIVAMGDKNGNAQYNMSVPGVFVLTMNSPFICDLKHTHPGIPNCPFSEKGHENVTISQKVVISTVSEVGKITTDPVSDKYLADTGQRVTLSYESHDGSTTQDKWRSRSVTLRIPVNFVPANPSEPGGTIIRDTLTTYVVAAPSAGGSSPAINQWSKIFAFKTVVLYKIKDGSIVPPTTPDVTCQASVASLILSHDTVKPSNTAGSNTQQAFTITCDGKASVTLTLSGTSSNQEFKDLSMGGVTTQLSMSSDAGATWFANKKMDVDKGSTHIMMQSKLRSHTIPGSYVGHDVITMTYQ